MVARVCSYEHDGSRHRWGGNGREELVEMGETIDQAEKGGR